MMRRMGLFLTALLVAGCQVSTVVTVHVDDDGSGVVEVAAGLDPEALENLPDLDGDGSVDLDDMMQAIRTEDLSAAGWEVSQPHTDGDLTMVRAVKPFGTPEEATAVLTELTGPDGPLRGLEVGRDTRFGFERFRFSGTADLSGGLEAFADEGLAEALEGDPLGESEAAIEERFGQPIAEMFSLEIRVVLPDGEERTWSPSLGGRPVVMAAEATFYDTVVLGLAAAAALCVLALLVVLPVRLRRGSRGAEA
jgi:hypothetical protein